MNLGEVTDPVTITDENLHEWLDDMKDAFELGAMQNQPRTATYGTMDKETESLG